MESTCGRFNQTHFALYQGELRASRAPSSSKVAPSKLCGIKHHGCSSGGPEGWSWGWARAYTTLAGVTAGITGSQRAKSPPAHSDLCLSIIGTVLLKTKMHQHQPLPSSHQQKVKALRRTAFSCHMLPSKSWVFLCTLTVISHIDMAAKRGLFDVLSCLCNGVSF